MTDLYKDETLFFVKKGTPQKLSYVVDQAINTISVLQNNANDFLIGDKKVPIKHICLWLLIERRTKLRKLSDSKSLIFLMKLVEWKKTTQNANYIPRVRINYIKPEDPS